MTDKAEQAGTLTPLSCDDSVVGHFPDKDGDLYCREEVNARIAELDDAIVERGAKIVELLGRVDELEQYKAMLDWVEQTMYDIRSLSVPTGGDDYDVKWQVYRHYMDKDSEPVLEWPADTPYEAIKQAMAQEGQGDG